MQRLSSPLQSRPAGSARSVAATRPAARRRARHLAVALAASGAALATAAGAQASASPSPTATHYAPQYHFRTVDNSNDPTFNQLLGINNFGVIAGYFGSGVQGHPNKGYFLLPHQGQLGYRVENFPGSVQTQVTGLNDRGVTVGFWSDMNNANQINDNFGFYAMDGHRFHTVDFPTTANATPAVDQLLGVNDRNIAVGFYTDAQGANHGYTYNIAHQSFETVNVPSSTSVTATAINNRNAVAGVFVNANGMTEGFLETANGHCTALAYPGATMTQALGVNDRNEVVGFYQVGTGSGAATHGFTWTAKGGFRTVDDPAGVGTTTVNGINDRGDLVGFYVDSAGNTDGMVATPGR